MNEILDKKSKKAANNAVKALVEKGRKITDKKIMADVLNGHYINVSQTFNSPNNVTANLLLDYHSEKYIDIKVPFSCPECTEDEITLIISQLKKTNSKDVFGISNNFIKLHAKALTPLITKLINKHLFEGDFPDGLKFSILKPLYKNKGSKEDKKSYRPVSLICILSKIFESVIYRRLLDHCNQNNFLHHDQFGYTSKSNPEAAMLHTMSDIYRSIDKKFLTALLTIDLSSAFDCIDHSILIIKLKKLQLPRFFSLLLESFLTGRKQSVILDDVLSEI